MLYGFMLILLEDITQAKKKLKQVMIEVGCYSWMNLPMNLLNS